MKRNELTKTVDRLHMLETDLEKAYQLLGKQTQEFAQQKSVHINQLVDEIITTKEKIQMLESHR